MTKITSNEFKEGLKEFYEKDSQILVWDTTKEFFEEVEDRYKAMTEQNYNPLREWLERTLKQYIKAAQEDKFKDDNER